MIKSPNFQVMFYSTKIFKMAGMFNENAQYATLAMGLVNVGMTVVSLVLVERAGRKILLLLGFQGMCVVSILLAICLAFAVGLKPSKKLATFHQ